MLGRPTSIWGSIGQNFFEVNHRIALNLNGLLVLQLLSGKFKKALKINIPHDDLIHGVRIGYHTKRHPLYEIKNFQEVI